jgi:Domain of unknown function (DUF1841)
MFVESRDQSRQFFFTVWEKISRSEALSPLEAVIAGVLRAHPEFHGVLGQGEKVLERDFGGSEANPFLHMGLHVALIEQLQTDRPAGITALYRQLLVQDGHDAHGLEHRLMEILAAVLWAANQRGAMPDEQEYLTRVRALLR